MGASDVAVVLQFESGARCAAEPLSDGQLLVGQTGGLPLPLALAGDGTLSADGTLTTTGGGVLVVAGAVTLTAASARNVVVSAAAGRADVTLPAVGAAGTWWRVKKSDTTANRVRVLGAGGALVDGAAYAELAAQYEALEVVSDGTNWLVF